MAGEDNNAEKLFYIENDDESLSCNQQIKEMDEEPEEGWMDVIDSDYAKDQLANTSSTWIVEENSDALAEYMDDVSEIIQLDDIENIDW